jgi:hypothetical protein
MIKWGEGGSEVKCREESVERREEWSVASRRAGEENIRRVRSTNKDRTEQLGILGTDIRVNLGDSI